MTGPAAFGLTDRVAIVTGASRGIGTATAGVFAAAGAHVVLVARDREALDRVAEEVAGQGLDPLVVAADLTERGAASEVVEQAVARFGRVDVLAAFAGGSGGRPRPLADLDDDTWAGAVDTNLTLTFRTLRAVLPRMIDQGSGSIVTMASSAARGPVVAPAAYAAAKAGIAALTRQVALEAAPAGVRVNCLAPSTIRTEALDRASAEQLEAMEQRHPLGRLGTPEDVAHAALFLASDASAWVTGITLDVAGGLVM